MPRNTSKGLDEQVTVTKKGFNYFCNKCVKSFRYKSLKETLAKGGMWNWLTCPDCGEIVTDLKRK